MAKAKMNGKDITVGISIVQPSKEELVLIGSTKTKVPKHLANEQVKVTSKVDKGVDKKVSKPSVKKTKSVAKKVTKDKGER